MGRQLKTVCLFAYLAVANHIVSKVPLNSLRCFLYRHLFLIKAGAGTVIHTGCYVMKPRQITIGEHTLINRQCTLDGRGKLTIGNNVDIAMHTMILTEGHDIQAHDYGVKDAPVTIGDRAAIYTRALILPGVTIGEGAVVGAGSVVTRDVPPYAVVGGAPAKVIGERNRDLTYTLRVSRYFE